MILEVSLGIIDFNLSNSPGFSDGERKQEQSYDEYGKNISCRTNDAYKKRVGKVYWSY